MGDRELLAEGFEAHRAHLQAVAYRMLGSASEAEDAVQEAWLRLSRSDTAAISNLGGWLTTVVGRVCLDMLRSRRSRREDPTGEDLTPRDSRNAPEQARHDAGDPEQQAVLADAVGSALLVVLETLGPAERLAFVLHDLFAVPFEEVAAVLGKSPAAARQLASRARRRLKGSERGAGSVGSERASGSAGSQGNQRASGSQGSQHASGSVGSVEGGPAGGNEQHSGGRYSQREIVDAFLAASREGNFGALLALLDPDVVLQADGAAVGMGAEAEVLGAQAVARTFSGRARGARPAVVDGAAGAVWAAGGKPRVVFGFAVLGGRVIRIELLADPVVLAGLRIEYPDAAGRHG